MTIPTIEQYEAALRRQMIYTNELQRRLARQSQYIQWLQDIIAVFEDLEASRQQNNTVIGLWEN